MEQLEMTAVVTMSEADRRGEGEGRLARRRRRGKDLPLGDQQINAQRAFEAAQVVAPGRYSLEDYLRAYEHTSRRRRAKHKDRAWLLAQLQALEEEERGLTATPRRGAASAAGDEARQRH